MMDEVRANGPDGNGIPLEADAALVWAHIDAVRPVTARVLVFPPVPYPVDVAIAALEPDTPEIRDMIAAGLAQMLLQEAEPGGSIFISQWSSAIAFTPSVRRFVLVSPAAQVDVQPGEIVALGTVSYT